MATQMSLTESLAILEAKCVDKRFLQNYSTA